jgi:Uma2 family endonuclease
MATSAIVPAEVPEDLLYERVNGEVLEKPMGAKAVGLANELLAWIVLYLQTNPVGRAFVEMLYRLRNAPRLERRPDVSFVPFERWPDRMVPDTDAWEMVPGLAVEIVSKTNTAEAIQDKIDEYFAAGVRLVWVIYPRQRRIQVYEDPKSIRVLDENDSLDGGPVLPGFRLAVSDLLGRG